jgi:hypothetical protein
LCICLLKSHPVCSVNSRTTKKNKASSPLCYINKHHKYRGGTAGWSGIRISSGAGNFSPHHRVQISSGTHPASYPMATRVSFLGGKVAGAWIWPLTSIYCRGQECVELYLHSPITLSWRCAQLKESTGTTSPLPFTIITSVLIRNVRYLYLTSVVRRLYAPGLMVQEH